MVSSNRLAREQRQLEKADILFLLYEQMGVERSLAKLFETGRAVGVRVSQKTLERYSAKYEWQRKLLERTVALREEREKDALVAVDKMNEGHIGVNRGLMSLAIAGINYYQNQLENKKRAGLPANLRLGVHDIVRLVKQAQLGERLARGEATNRTEIVTEVIGTFVQEFAVIFKTVNSIESPGEREREYIRLFDERLREVYAAQATSSVVKKVTAGTLERIG